MQNPYAKYEKLKGPQASTSSHSVKAKVPTKTVVKKSVKPSRKQESNMSWGFITLCFVGLCLSFYIVFYTDDFLALAQRVRIGWSVSEAADKEKTSPEKEKKSTEEGQLPVGQVTLLNADVDSLTMKNSSVYKALKDKEESLSKKERDLVRMEEDLQKQKAEIEKQLIELKEMKRSISSKLDSKVEADQESVDKLVGVYSSMKPQNAATIISQLDEQLAVKILSKMKQQVAAGILNFVEPQKAQMLSEKYAGLKR